MRELQIEDDYSRAPVVLIGAVVLGGLLRRDRAGPAGPLARLVVGAYGQL